MFIQAPELLSHAKIRHAFFTRQGEVSNGIYASLNGGLGSDDIQADVRENRVRMAEVLHVEEPHLLSLYQIHSPTVIVTDRPWPSSRPQADAMVTKVPGLALGISTADCGPVLFVDPENNVIGASHAGWKGAIGGVLEATIVQMEKQGAVREKIIAVLGPTISQKAYEVGPEFAARFREENEANKRFFKESGKPGHFLFNLPAYIGSRLEKAGIGAFTDIARCTYSDEEKFYSYRRATHLNEPDYGRLISAISISL